MARDAINAIRRTIKIAKSSRSSLSVQRPLSSFVEYGTRCQGPTVVMAGLIAQELALSERTVAHHLTSILNTTATENRAAAAAFAIHHGLA